MEMTCPLCKALVKSGIFHQCADPPDPPDMDDDEEWESVEQ
jgi:hypothetical protein